MKIKRFKPKRGVTQTDLLALGFRPGGSWIKDDAQLFLSVSLNDKCNLSLDIAFGANITEWNDFDNILILDEDICQPYTPFYGENYGKDITDFPALEAVIANYNRQMTDLGIFEEIKESEE